MLTRAGFDHAITAVSDPASRIATFGAMLAKESGLGSKLIIAGGSAMAIHSHGRFASDGVDVIGERAPISRVLKRWGFQPEEDTDGRVYWRRDDLGLFIDIIHRSAAYGSGRLGPTRKIMTAQGPVRVSAIEDLIVRRMVFWKRDGRSRLMEQAAVLFAENSEELDLDYLRAEVRWEGIEDAYRELIRRLG